MRLIYGFINKEKLEEIIQSMPIAEQETVHHSFVPLQLPKVRIEIEVMWGCLICWKESLDEAGLGIVMAVFVIIGVKGGTGIKKLIENAVMLNSLLSVICFLPGVDSYYYDYSDIDRVQFYDEQDQRPSKTIQRRFRRDDSAMEDVGIIIGSFVGIVTLILAFGIIYSCWIINCCRHCGRHCGRHYPARHMNITSSSTHDL